MSSFGVSTRPLQRGGCLLASVHRLTWPLPSDCFRESRLPAIEHVARGGITQLRAGCLPTDFGKACDSVGMGLMDLVMGAS